MPTQAKAVRLLIESSPGPNFIIYLQNNFYQWLIERNCFEIWRQETKPVSWLEDIERAKRPERLPVVFTRELKKHLQLQISRVKEIHEEDGKQGSGCVSHQQTFHRSPIRNRKETFYRSKATTNPPL